MNKKLNKLNKKNKTSKHDKSNYMENDVSLDPVKIIFYNDNSIVEVQEKEKEQKTKKRPPKLNKKDASATRGIHYNTHDLHYWTLVNLPMSGRLEDEMDHLSSGSYHFRILGVSNLDTCTQSIVYSKPVVYKVTIPNGWLGRWGG